MMAAPSRQSLSSGRASIGAAAAVSANLQHGILLLENLTADEMKTRLKRHKLPYSGTKIQLMKRLKLAQLPDEKLKEMCRSRGFLIGSSNRESLAPDGRKKLVSRRDMISVLEKFPGTVNLACPFVFPGKNNGMLVARNAAEENDFPDGAVDDELAGVLDSQSTTSSYMPGYRSSSERYVDGEYYSEVSLTAFDNESTLTSSTAERILEWLFWRPVSQCRECKKLLPTSEKPIVNHLAVEHGLDYDAAPSTVHSALLFKVSSFESFMSMYVWCRPTATFRELVSIITRRWMEQCHKECNHFSTIYLMGETGSRPQSVFYTQFHDKVDIGPMFDMKDNLHTHLVEILQRRPFRLLFGERQDITQVAIQYCKQLNVKPTVGQDGREVQGGIFVESTLPEIPCTVCGRLATMTAASHYGGLNNASRCEFFCGKRCAKQRGFYYRLVKLSNSPRCSSCKCASFVYADSSWEKADAEDHSRPSDETLNDDVGALGDLSEIEAAVDEIAAEEEEEEEEEEVVNDDDNENPYVDDYNEIPPARRNSRPDVYEAYEAGELNEEADGVDKDETLTGAFSDSADDTVVSSTVEGDNNNAGTTHCDDTANQKDVTSSAAPSTARNLLRLSNVTNTADVRNEQGNVGQKIAQRLANPGKISVTAMAPPKATKQLQEVAVEPPKFRPRKS